MITRWDPFQDLMSLRNTVDRMFDRTFGTEGNWQPTAMNWGLALDVVENEDEYLVKASLPGINPDDLEITFTNNILTIKGEVKEETEEKEARYHLRERRYGTFSRSISIPTQVKYENGVLYLHLPKTEEVKPRRIPIQSGETKVIEATTSKN
jgi:HSP20 family protein